MNEKRSAIFIVDMIKGFVKEGALHDEHIMEIVPDIIHRLNDHAQQHRYFIVDSHAPDAIEFQAFPTHCVKGTSQVDIIDELQPYVAMDETHGSPVIYEKNSTNASWIFDFDDIAAHYDECIITGCCTDICIMQLAIGLKTYMNEHNHNVAVIVPRNCVATYDAPQHDAATFHEMALRMMQMAGIQII